MGITAGLVVVLSTTFLLAGCFHREEVVILPRTESQSQSEIGLGPGVRPLSSGLGEKGSPAWSPSGNRIAFTMDGYVVEKEIAARDFERKTTKDFKAQTLTWTPSGGGLTILGADSRSGRSEARVSTSPWGVYKTVQGEGSLEVSKVANGVQQMASGPPDSGWILLATDAGGSTSRLALLENGGDIQPYTAGVKGEVTGISVSPTGDQATLAVRDPASGRFEVYVFSPGEGSFQRVAQLKEGIEVFGDPQWTKQGIYYVAGEQRETGNPEANSFDLYRVSPEGSTPERAPGVGDDFVASSLKRDPEGERLAVIGRRNPGSAENLYILDLGSERLEAVTSNENMQIKTGTEDLAWSANGDSVVIVARAVLSEPKVYSAPADTLVTDFYNLYEVPTTEIAMER